MKYAYYIGCIVPSRLNQYDLAVRRISEELGIQLVDLDGASCCGTVITRSINAEANLIMSLRILVLAENKGLDLLVTCPGCYESIIEAHEVFHNNPSFREEANMILNKLDNLTYDGKMRVKHFIQVLYEDVGLEKLKDRVKKPLNGLKAAAHYGCHILRPSSKLKFDDPENPKIFDKLIDITGAKSIYWTLKLWCCGSPIQTIDRNLSLSLTAMKLRSAKDAEADCIVTICPSCQLQFDFMQSEASKITGEKYDMPILLYPQLLGLSMGLHPEEVGLNLNRSSIERFLEHLKELRGERDG
ncbi:MAG: CoB--CoM heterodisulfide reductase iron-sulfur subunit B family protein [Nitrososphaeria archaeon]|nr:CoB--CoM heterodisulfide reductase iron-sulfur subunit B family protein [Nitrososphaeria archaeon]MDW7986562.1 CoB--CoM heterodisulfide reductase iron-sulfur subunit B family protein [Nitrososphaerota archaeon]